MALQPSGLMSIGGPTSGRSINLELGRSATATSSLGESDLRSLAGVPSGAISMSDFYGASSFSASGGNVNGLAPGNGYKYHTFTSPGTFTVTGSGDVEFLIVGGGGGGRSGGGAAGGGGGAGGLTYNPSHPLTDGGYTIVVGSGSPAKSYNSPAPTPVASRVSSAFGSSVDGGGDAGSYSPYAYGDAGGSGGGGGAYGSPLTGGAATGNGTGNSGGTGLTGSDPSYAGGGGGGAGAAGQPGGNGPATRSDGGNGLQYSQFEGSLIGVPALSPLSGYFAGGGGGAVRIQPVANRPQGGLGGGGLGGTRTPSTVGGENGVANSGGGGGGDSAGPTSGAGGSGIVIIRYLA